MLGRSREDAEPKLTSLVDEVNVDVRPLAAVTCEPMA